MFETMQIYLLQLINRFRRNEDGAALAEYGLLVALIAVVCVVAITALGTQVSTAFSKIASNIAGAYNLTAVLSNSTPRLLPHTSNFSLYSVALLRGLSN